MTRDPRIVALGVLLASSIAGCGARAHLTESYSESYRAALKTQAVPPKVDPSRSIEGLDPQDATIIARAYRFSLGPKEQQGQQKEEPVIIVAPPQQGGAARATLAPSVPKDSY